MKEYCSIHGKKIVKSLKTAKLKVTPIRVRLMDALEHAKVPVRAKDLLKKAKSDLATVYRNLESLINLGLVNRVFLNQKEAYFEIGTTQHHHHAICENCGKVVDVKNLGHKKIDQKALSASGFAKINKHSLEFFGVCKNCQNK